MKPSLLAVGILAVLAGSQGLLLAAEEVPRTAVEQQTTRRPPALQALHGPSAVVVGGRLPIFITGEAGAADLKEIVFRVWAAGRGNIASGSFPLSQESRRQVSGKIEIDTVASVPFVQSRDFEKLPMEIHVQLRDAGGGLSPAQVHRFEFDERAPANPLPPPPGGKDDSKRLGIVYLEVFPLDRGGRGLPGRRGRGF
ncbi:MAG: hypothetical protein HYY21_01695 [Candidatus Tectomicrobia bacterium]|nr:hypothetical protein [Candidatus Tectomicrobia bacterium]